MRIRMHLGIGIVAAALIAPFQLSAQIVTNGGFELPTTPAGSFTVFTSGGAGPNGWVVVGASGNVATVSNTFTTSGIDFPAHTGNAWLDLTGTSNSATGVAQTFATTIGSTYALSFWVGNVCNPSGQYGTTSTVLVSQGSQSLLTAENTTCLFVSQTPSQFWEQFTGNFTATSASTTLTFMNGDPSTDSSNGLDDVSVALVSGTTTTPEPGSLALLGTGLVGLVPVMRRRKR